MNMRFVIVGISLGILVTIAVIIGSPANPLNLDFGGLDGGRNWASIQFFNRNLPNSSR